MSSDSDEFSGYHDFESWGYNFVSDEEHERNERDKNTAVFVKERENDILKNEGLKKLAKLTALCSDARDTKQTIIKYTVSKILDSTIQRYCKKENLPPQFSALPRDPSALYQIVVQHIKLLDIPLVYEDLAALKQLAAELNVNSDNYTVYDRVGAIQAQVHMLSERIMGAGSSKILDKNIMIQFLSTCRLSLSIQDILGKPPEYILTQLKMNEQNAVLENLTSVTDPAKNLIRNWKIRHLRSLLYYAPIEARSIIRRLFDLSIEQTKYQMIKQANDIIFD